MPVVSPITDMQLLHRWPHDLAILSNLTAFVELLYAKLMQPLHVLRRTASTFTNIQVIQATDFLSASGRRASRLNAMNMYSPRSLGGAEVGHCVF